MQGSEIELGGFKGRTNKLVDGCYSWWVGGAFTLLGALGIAKFVDVDELSHAESEVQPGSDSEGWDDVDGLSTTLFHDRYSFYLLDSLLNRKALQEYILYAGQHPAGGLRDKPPKCVPVFFVRFTLTTRRP